MKVTGPVFAWKAHEADRAGRRRDAYCEHPVEALEAVVAVVAILLIFMGDRLRNGGISSKSLCGLPGRSPFDSGHDLLSSRRKWWYSLNRNLSMALSCYRATHHWGKA